MCLPRITQPERVQRLLLAQLNWQLPEQPPPRIYDKDLPQGPPSAPTGDLWEHTLKVLDLLGAEVSFPLPVRSA